MTRLAAYLLGLWISVVPGLAWAQIQPMPVFNADGDYITLVDRATTPIVFGADVDYSTGAVDFAGFGAVEVLVYSWPGVGSKVCTYQLYMLGSDTLSTPVISWYTHRGANAHRSYIGAVADIYNTGWTSYEISPVPKYGAFVVHAESAVGGAGSCYMSVSVRGKVRAAMTTGQVVAGTSASNVGLIAPVIVGGLTSPLDLSAGGSSGIVVPMLMDSSGRMITTPQAADGGLALTKAYGSQNLPLLQGGPNGTLISEGFSLKPTGCVEAVASTVGDGGTLAVSNVAPNSRYVLTVDETSAVRIAQGAPCVGYASGTGVGIPIPSGSVLPWKAYPIGDAGTSTYTLCAETATTTRPIVTLCPASP